MKRSDGHAVPPLLQRLLGVWYRHLRVYARNLVSNAFPPFLEPLVFLVGIGLGLGTYIATMDGMPYIQFLATGLLVTVAMFTASFECTFGTFIRMEFDKNYDGILAAPVTVRDLFAGEILWAGTKGFFFSTSVLIILFAFGIVRTPVSLLAPLVGFAGGLMFACLGLAVTSYVKTINHFSFYFTGCITPMFFFSGVVFPISRLPAVVRPIVEALPLTHLVRLARAACMGAFEPMLLLDVLYCLLFIPLVGGFAIHRLRRRIVR
jgi:lipooligosaccharide transport system permease protein